jgi:hypothetical protein
MVTHWLVFVRCRKFLIERTTCPNELPEKTRCEKIANKNHFHVAAGHARWHVAPAAVANGGNASRRSPWRHVRRPACSIGRALRQWAMPPPAWVTSMTTPRGLSFVAALQADRAAACVGNNTNHFLLWTRNNMNQHSNMITFKDSSGDFKQCT